jgi:hypothetical protein
MGVILLQYSRWGRVAEDLQIPEDIFFENLVFDKSIKPGDLMTGAMSEDSVQLVWSCTT